MIDDDDDLDPALLPSPDLHGADERFSSHDELGAGRALDHSDGHDDEREFEFGSRGNDWNRSEHGDRSFDSVEQHAFATPTARRRREGEEEGEVNSSAGHTPSKRQSLAFELRSASSPGKPDRDLLRDLGIDEEDGDGDAQSEKSIRDEGDYEAPVSPWIAQHGLAEQLQHRLAPAPGISSPPRRSRSSAHEASSTTSLSRTPEGGGATSPGSDGASCRDLEAVLADNSSALASSVQATTDFISRLSQYMTTSDATAPISTPSLNDRQPIVENMASRVIKTMQEVVRVREGQVRELVDLERAFARSDPGWQAALAGLDALPVEEEDGENGARSNGGVGPMTEDEERTLRPASLDLEAMRKPSTLPTPLSPLVEVSPMTDASVFPSPPRSPNLDLPQPRPPPRHTQTSTAPAILLLEHFASLRAHSTSLSATLSSLHEMTQVNQAAASEHGRKLRAVRVHLGNMADELAGAERSEEYVERWERNERLLDAGANAGAGAGRVAAVGRGRRRRRAEEAREEMRAVEIALEDGWRKAQRMLTVGAGLVAAEG